MRKLSNKAIVLQVLMVFILLSVSVFAAPSNTKSKTTQSKARVSKKLEVQKAVKSVNTGKLEVDAAQLVLDTGIQRMHESLECQ